MNPPVREWVRADFGIDLVTLDPVGHGGDEAALLWRGATADGSVLAVKLTGGGSSAGLVVPARMAAAGVPGLVAPLSSRDGRLWSERDGRRLSLVPWVSDDRALGGVMTGDHWTSYGRLLRQVHALDLAREGLAGALPREEHRHDRTTAAVQAVSARLDAVSGRSRAPAAEPDATSTRAMEVWRLALPPMTTLLRRVDRLGSRLRQDPAADVLCHGDPHLGNVLLGAGGQVWLIDWDDAVVAPRERDLFFVTVGVLAFAPVTDEERARFFEGYGPAELDDRRLAYYLGVRALDDLSSWVAMALDAQRWDLQQRREAVAIAEGLLSPTGLVTLALAAQPS